MLLVACVAVLLAHPGRGLVHYVRNHGSAGRIARYLLPIPFVLPYVSSAVTKWAVEHRVGDPVVIFWAFALFNTAAAALLILAAVERLDDAERARVAAHNALLRANDELERGVRDRTQELATANAALAATNAELEQFAYLSAHDLQEPLRVVRVYAQLLERRAPDMSGEMREHLHTVIAAVERMQVLVRDVQTYSESLHTSPTYGEVDLKIVVERAIQRLAGMILSAKADLRYAQLPVVRGSADQLETVFVQLFTNAVKFQSDERPRIRITAAPSGHQCEIRVSDNGVGISPAYHERIFGLFKRLHARTEGTGLGLALCKRIITAHGGRIWVTSSLGEGATFHFTLPAADTRHQPSQAATP
jgi:light-regulated signal transduction histidine kinase (bacteriophytochrome)